MDVSPYFVDVAKVSPLLLVEFRQEQGQLYLTSLLFILFLPTLIWLKEKDSEF